MDNFFDVRKWKEVNRKETDKNFTFKFYAPERRMELSLHRPFQARSPSPSLPNVQPLGTPTRTIKKLFYPRNAETFWQTIDLRNRKLRMNLYSCIKQVDIWLKVVVFDGVNKIMLQRTSGV